MTTVERILEAYRHELQRQTIEMWLRGDIRWCSLASVLR